MFGLKYYSSLDKYRNTPEFMEVYSYIEKEYQKEHEQIKKLLLQEGLLEKPPLTPPKEGNQKKHYRAFTL